MVHQASLILNGGRHGIRANNLAVFVILGILLPGCYSPASPAQRGVILTTLLAYESTRPDRLPKDLGQAQISVRDDEARARYSVQPRFSQFTSVPIRVGLRSQSGQWRVVSETEYQPTWPHLEVRTITME